MWVSANHFFTFGIYQIGIIKGARFVGQRCMKNNLEQAKELNSQVRDFVRKNADRLFDRLEKEEDKRANQ